MEENLNPAPSPEPESEKVTGAQIPSELPAPVNNTSSDGKEEKKRKRKFALRSFFAPKAERNIVNGKVLTAAQMRKRSVLRWTLLVVGIIMMSCSVYFFQTPNDFTLGGIAGIAIIINSFIPAPVNQILTQGVIMAIINVALLIIGLIVLGKQCTVRTIFCSLFYTCIIWLFEYLDIVGLINTAVGRVETIINPETGETVTRALRTLTDEPLLELVYAILFFGVGGAMIFNCGASSGGTDIIALILKKYTKLNVGMALMIIDMIVVLISFYTFDVDKGLFSVLGLFTKSFLLDGVIESISKTKYITIITTKPEEIGEYILKTVNHSFTSYDAEGGYSHEKRKILVTVCKRGEALKLKSKVKSIDPDSFVILTDANEILGKGFGDAF